MTKKLYVIKSGSEKGIVIDISKIKYISDVISDPREAEGCLLKMTLTQQEGKLQYLTLYFSNREEAEAERQSLINAIEED